MDNEKMVKKGKYWTYETGFYKDRRKRELNKEPVINEVHKLDGLDVHKMIEHNYIHKQTDEELKGWRGII